jgi:hypothetical protein
MLVGSIVLLPMSVLCDRLISHVEHGQCRLSLTMGTRAFDFPMFSALMDVPVPDPNPASSQLREKGSLTVRRAAEDLHCSGAFILLIVLLWIKGAFVCLGTASKY